MNKEYKVITNEGLVIYVTASSEMEAYQIARGDD